MMSEITYFLTWWKKTTLTSIYDTNTLFEREQKLVLMCLTTLTLPFLFLEQAKSETLTFNW